MIRCSLGMAVLLFVSVSTAVGGDWPQWRGPNFNGSTDESNLPTEWTTTENIVWSADLPGASAATPIVSGDHVFVSSTDPDANTLIALCFDRQTGQLRWQHTVGEGIRKDSRSDFASSSPVTNGELVVFFYGNGDTVAFDFDGDQLWKRNIQDDLGQFAFLWTFSSSPLLLKDKLYLQVLQRDVPVDGRGFADRPNDSYLLAVDPKSGETLWRQTRPSDARAESREAFTTPIPFEHAGRREILIVGGDVITGHDPETGQELWRWGTWNPSRIGHWRHVPSAVASDDVILVCAPKRDPIYAIQAGGTGTLGDDDVVWVSRDEDKRVISSDVPTPAFYDGDFFVLSDVRKTLSRVEPKTGNVKWSVSTPGRDKYEASPLAADGKIYLMNFIGEVVVINASDGAIINVIPMDEPSRDAIRSSISAAHGQLFIRTNRTLYCVGS